MAASNLREVNEIANSLALLISGRAQEEETEILDLSRMEGNRQRATKFEYCF